MAMNESTTKQYKRPESVLIVVYSGDGKVLLLKRVDHPNFWQSVTGAMHWAESDPRATAVRELREETGLIADPARLCDLRLVQRYAILPQWRRRYAPDVTHNTEHAFALELPTTVALAAHPEHSEYIWLESSAAAAMVTSWTNRAAIEHIARRWRHG